MKSKNLTMQKLGDVLVKFNPLEDKYISREFQAYGYYLAESLNDLQHRGIYMKLAKTMPRALLEKALSQVKDAKGRKKGALFMWTLKKMGAWEKSAKVKSEKSKVKDIPF